METIEKSFIKNPRYENLLPMIKNSISNQIIK